MVVKLATRRRKLGRGGSGCTLMTLLYLRRPRVREPSAAPPSFRLRACARRGLGKPEQNGDAGGCHGVWESVCLKMWRMWATQLTEPEGEEMRARVRSLRSESWNVNAFSLTIALNCFKHTFYSSRATEFILLVPGIVRVDGRGNDTLGGYVHRKPSRECVSLCAFLVKYLLETFISAHCISESQGLRQRRKRHVFSSAAPLSNLTKGSTTVVSRRLLNTNLASARPSNILFVIKPQHAPTPLQCFDLSGGEGF